MSLVDCEGRCEWRVSTAADMDTYYILRPAPELFNKKKPVSSNAKRARPVAKLRAKALVVMPFELAALPASPLMMPPKGLSELLPELMFEDRDELSRGAQGQGPSTCCRR